MEGAHRLKQLFQGRLCNGCRQRAGIHGTVQVGAAQREDKGDAKALRAILTKGYNGAVARDLQTSMRVLEPTKQLQSHLGVHALEGQDVGVADSAQELQLPLDMQGQGLLFREEHLLQRHLLVGGSVPPAVHLEGGG